MLIEGPLIISVKDDEATMNRELHLTFTPTFVQQKVFERVEALQSYMDKLYHQMARLEENDPKRAGMETVYQICDNLLEYIRGDEIDLDQTIIIEIKPDINITSFITGSPTLN